MSLSWAKWDTSILPRNMPFTQPKPWPAEVIVDGVSASMMMGPASGLRRRYWDQYSTGRKAVS